MKYLVLILSFSLLTPQAFSFWNSEHNSEFNRRKGVLVKRRKNGMQRYRETVRKRTILKTRKTIAKNHGFKLSSIKYIGNNTYSVKNGKYMCGPIDGVFFGSVIRCLDRNGRMK